MSITETDVNAAAQQLILRLDDLLEILDVPAGRGSPVVTSGALCLSSDLDWLTLPNGSPISMTTTKRQLDRQLALCQSCGIAEECLQIALTEKKHYGIWGGYMPYERRRMMDEQTG